MRQFWRHSSFRTRMLVTLVVFVLLAEAVVALAILRTSYVRTIDQAQDRLAVGERVLDQLMSLRDERLLSSVDILTSDFGFKSAVATDDDATLHSSLANFGARVHADFAVLLSPDGSPMASLSAGGRAAATQPLTGLLDQARRTGSGSGLVMIHHRPTQFVLVPVKAPRLIAWAGMGFVIDRRFANTLADLTGLGVTFLVTDHGTHVASVTSRGVRAADLADGSHLSRRQSLLDNAGSQLAVALSLPRAEVLTGYYALARRLGLIFLGTLAASALLAIWLSRRLSAPVAEMSEFARSVTSGAYTSAPPSKGMGEFEQLAGALTEMRDAVRERESRIRHQATHDPLTGLPNRGQARERIDQYLATGRPFAAVRLAVRGFGRINSALGYQLGDRTLQVVASRLREQLAGQHLVARTEGNDFLLILADGTARAELERRLVALRGRLEKPMDLAGTVLQLEFAIGVLLSPADAADTETVWRRSTIAREWSSQRRGSIVFYDAGMDERQFRELTIIRDLPRAVARDELHLAFQPKLTLATGAVRQVEALVRWQHPSLGFVPPDEFIGLAERSGQIDQLTRWVTRTAAAQLEAWRAARMPLGIAINLSADEIADSGLAETVAPVLEAADRPGDITLEVTESAVLREPTAALANLRALQARGARIAMDDFGTGYSSFSQLRQLGANELKIDKSLVFNLDDGPADQHIVAAIIALGHQLDLEVVAEGIENEASWRFLSRHGADSMQGFYLARPMPADQLGAWLHRHDLVATDWAASASS